MPDITTPAAAVATDQKQEFKSRHGYHPCSRETWKQLKTIRRVIELQKRQLATHDRWARKLPKNRVIRRKIRNDKKQVIGYEILGSQPQPHICPLGLTPRLEELHKYARRPHEEPCTVFDETTIKDIAKYAEDCVQYEASRKKK